MAGMGHLFPSYLFVFQGFVFLDIFSHWLHMTATHLSGSSSHKNIDLKKNAVLRLYYTNKPFLVFIVFANECERPWASLGCHHPALELNPTPFCRDGQVHVECVVSHPLS
jgi:CDP-diacylglycerol--inositol 3-phosphatidyltransferase